MPEPRAAFADLERRIREASMYIDPVNRACDAYLRGDIDVEEFELRVNDLLGLERRWLGSHDGSQTRLEQG